MSAMIYNKQCARIEEQKNEMELSETSASRSKQNVWAEASRDKQRQAEC